MSTLKRYSLPIALVVAVVSSTGFIPAQERPLRRITIPVVITAAAFSPDGKTLTAWDAGGYSTWSAETGRRVAREPIFAKSCDRALVLPRTSGGRVVGVSCKGRVQFFDAGSATPLGERILGEKETAATYTASADGKSAALVIAGETGTVRLVDLAGGPGIAVEIGAEVERVSFPAAGTRFMVGSVRGVDVRSIPDGSLIRTIEGGPSHAVSADGRVLAIVTPDGAKLVEAVSGETMKSLEGRVSHVQFGAESTLVAGWTNQRVIVWDVATGAQRLVLTGEEFVGVAMAPDGSRLATISLTRRGEETTTTLAVWRLPESTPARD